MWGCDISRLCKSTRISWIKKCECGKDTLVSSSIFGQNISAFLANNLETWLACYGFDVFSVEMQTCWTETITAAIQTCSRHTGREADKTIEDYATNRQISKLIRFSLAHRKNVHSYMDDNHEWMWAKAHSQWGSFSLPTCCCSICMCVRFWLHVCLCVKHQFVLVSLTHPPPCKNRNLTSDKKSIFQTWKHTT